MSFLMNTPYLVQNCTINFELKFDENNVFRITDFLIISKEDESRIFPNLERLENFIVEILFKNQMYPYLQGTIGQIELDYEYTEILLINDSNEDDEQFVRVDEFNTFVK
jgi:hypothetical protein